MFLNKYVSVIFVLTYLYCIAFVEIKKRGYLSHVFIVHGNTKNMHRFQFKGLDLGSVPTELSHYHHTRESVTFTVWFQYTGQ